MGFFLTIISNPAANLKWLGKKQRKKSPMLSHREFLVSGLSLHAAGGEAAGEVLLNAHEEDDHRSVGEDVSGKQVRSFLAHGLGGPCSR